MKNTLFSLLLLISLIASAQKCTISGKVFDENNEGLPEAVVIVDSLGIGTTTDFDGNYSFTTTYGKHQLTCRYMGYKSLTLYCQCGKDTGALNFKMSPDTVNLSSVAISVGRASKLVSDDIVSIDVISSSEIRTSPGVAVIRTRSRADRAAAKSYRAAKSKGATTANGAGVLTSGEVNDFSKWKMWSGLDTTIFAEHAHLWGFYPKHRYVTEVKTTGGFPVCDAFVSLMDLQGNIIWKTRTDNTGKAELWAGMFDTTQGNAANYKIEVKYADKEQSIDSPKQFPDGINRVTFNVNCGSPNAVDIVFTVDATSSMGDEISYLKTELLDVIRKAQNNNHNINLRLGTVFYRDKFDAYLTKYSPLDKDIDKAYNFIKEQYAEGGGDYPEAVDDALVTALDSIQWNPNATARIMFLILDAPPHQTREVEQNLEKYIQLAAAKGVRIVPLACSGVDKSTEYIMRSFALATNGTYTFLTDHSGIGGTHLKPSTDKYKVEKMNDLIMRIILQYSYYPDCDAFMAKKELEQKRLLNESAKNFMVNDTADKEHANVLDEPLHENDFADNVKYYPNPTGGELNILAKGSIDDLYLTDISGKVLERYTVKKGDKITVNIGNYAAGIYFIRYYKNEHWNAGKVILIKGG